MQTVILILAAGSSSRMRGVDKLLEIVFGQPLIAHISRQAIKTHTKVFVAVPTLDHLRAKALKHLDLELIAIQDAAYGMAASIRTCILAIPADVTHVAITPADLPDLTTSDFATLIDMARDADPATIFQAINTSGQAGHPVVFPRRYFPELLALEGDRGAKPVLTAHRQHIVQVPLPEAHATTDLDTAEDWVNWRGLNPDT